MEEQTQTAVQAAEPEKQPYTAQTFLNDLQDILCYFLAAFFVVILLFAYICCPAAIVGPSMEPTLQDGDRVLVLRGGREYQTGDILIIESDNAYTFNQENRLVRSKGLEEQIVKRLIARGGQTVDIDFKSGTVTVDGKVLDEPYIKETTHYNSGGFSYPLTVPEGYLFVMGDNRNLSKDSRSHEIGLQPEGAVVGRAVYRILPLGSIGAIE